MRQFDYAPLFRSTVGFDKVFDRLDTMLSAEAAPTYPPYNIEQFGTDAYRITMAVAGFTAEDLTVEVQDTTLSITGRKDVKSDSKRTFLHQGIAERGFERRFQLADHVVVRDVKLTNGLLEIALEREVPERLKPRRIEITTADGTDRPALENGSDSKAA